MKKKIPPALKGFISAVLMIGVALIVFYKNLPAESPIQYLIYVIYIAGIIGTLWDYRRSAAFTGKFVDLFNQGFRCFIVVMLMMVTFTFVFNKMHPEFAEESSKSYKEEMLADKTKDRTPTEIDDAVSSYKGHYNTVLIYGAIFGYLIIGAGATAVVSLLLTRRKA